VTPIQHFEAVWRRCAHLSAIHRYIAPKVTSAIDTDEILRAEWVARIGALDLYVHECVAQGMLEIFSGLRTPTDSFLKFKLSNETLLRIQAATSKSDASSAFDLDIRSQLSKITYQKPEAIADGIRLFSTIEVWNSVALKLGATAARKSDKAKQLKQDLSLLVERRNKIAHEGDLQPAIPREPWLISQLDLRYVEEFVESIVRAIDEVA
jgi:hypothetical protein